MTSSSYKFVLNKEQGNMAGKVKLMLNYNYMSIRIHYCTNSHTPFYNIILLGDFFVYKFVVHSSQIKNNACSCLPYLCIKKQTKKHIVLWTTFV